MSNYKITDGKENFNIKYKPCDSEDLNLLNNYINFNFLPETKNFELLGDKSFIREGQETHYEVFYRYCKLNSEFEIMFKDVTRSKNNEQKIADFKYKTVFLSKIAHEFKNPIVSMCELVEQSNDDLERLKNKNTNEIKSSLKIKFNQLKSLSDFLLILIKDLNYFSEHSLEKNIIIEEKETEVQKIIEFSENITNSLLYKSYKYRNVKFQIELEGDVPDKINTDEWRLKQVLINLLSNAVKFTLNGKIQLKLFVEHIIFCGTSFLHFQVIDSGVGIKEDDQKKLFKPFQKGTHISDHIGSGLGLFIAQEISSKLGTGLQLVSSTSNGSTFSFSIPIYKNHKKEYLPHMEVLDKSSESKSTNKFENVAIMKSEIDLKYMTHIYSDDSSCSQDELDIFDYQKCDSSILLSKQKLSATKDVSFKEEGYITERRLSAKKNQVSENLTTKEFFMESCSNLNDSVLK
jgi:signal transduction histidine kinase